MFIGGVRNILDEVSDADVVAERVPRLARHFDAIKDLREIKEEMAPIKSGSLAVGMTNKRTMMHLFNIPMSIWSVWESREPGYFSKRKNAYKFRNEHPEYRIGKHQIR